MAKILLFVSLIELVTIVINLAIPVGAVGGLLYLVAQLRNRLSSTSGGSD